MHAWHNVAIADLESRHECIHRAYLNSEETWNGWACPYFEKPEVERMSASHTGKTLLAQRMLEEYRCPYLSIDHLKIESQNLRLLRTNTTTPQSPRPSF